MANVRRPNHRKTGGEAVDDTAIPGLTCLHQFTYYLMVRLSINLDDQLYGHASAIAKAEAISLSAAIGLLIRRGLESFGNTGTPHKPKRTARGVPLVACDRVFSSEDVARLEDGL